MTAAPCTSLAGARCSAEATIRAETVPYYYGDGAPPLQRAEVSSSCGDRQTDDDRRTEAWQVCAETEPEQQARLGSCSETAAAAVQIATCGDVVVVWGRSAETRERGPSGIRRSVQRRELCGDGVLLVGRGLLLLVGPSLLSSEYYSRAAVEKVVPQLRGARHCVRRWGPLCSPHAVGHHPSCQPEHVSLQAAYCLVVVLIPPAE